MLGYAAACDNRAGATAESGAVAILGGRIASLLIQGTINFLTGAMLDNISREPYFEDLSDEIAVHCRRSLSAGR